MPKKFVHEIVRLNVTLEEQIDFVLDLLSRNRSDFLRACEDIDGENSGV